MSKYKELTGEPKFPEFTEEQTEMFNKALPLVDWVIKTRLNFLDLRTRGKYEDCHQEGLTGLCKAIRKHDPKKGKLSTIAILCIETFIIRHYVRFSKSYIIPYNTSLSEMSNLPREVCWQKVPSNFHDSTPPKDDFINFKLLLEDLSEEEAYIIYRRDVKEETLREISEDSDLGVIYTVRDKHRKIKSKLQSLNTK